MRHHHPRQVGVLGIATGAQHVVPEIQRLVEGDRVREQHLATDQHQAIASRHPQQVAVLEQQLVTLAGAGDQHLPQRLDRARAIHPLQQQLGLVLAQPCLVAGARARGQRRGLEAFQRGLQHLLLAILHAQPEQLDALLVRALGELDLPEQLAHARAVGEHVFLRTLVLALDPHRDRALLLVGGEGEFVAVEQRDLLRLFERVVFDVAGAAGIAHHPHVVRLRLRLGEARQGTDGEDAVGELEAIGVLCHSGDQHRIAPRLDEDHVTVGELYQRHAPVEQEVIEVDLCPHRFAALDLHREKRTALGIDATGLVEIMQQAVHAGAVVETGAIHETADEYPHRLRRGQARITVDIGAKHPRHRRFHHPLQILVAHPEHLDRTDVGQEQVALGVDQQQGVEVETAPQADLDLVAGRHHVIRVELGRAHARKTAGEELGAEHIAVQVHRVIECGRAVGNDPGGGGVLGRHGFTRWRLLGGRGTQTERLRQIERRVIGGESRAAQPGEENEGNQPWHVFSPCDRG